jgi:hypothetical protein
MTRRLLVVATAPDPADELLEHLRQQGDDVEIAIVAPESDMSFREWLADDDREARERAQERALQAAEVEALIGRVVGVHIGDPNPVLAVEDVLRTFPADELIVVTSPDDAATPFERAVLRGELDRFGLPVTYVVDDDAPRVGGEARRPEGLSRSSAQLIALLACLCLAVAALGVALYFSLR